MIISATELQDYFELRAKFDLARSSLRSRIVEIIKVIAVFRHPSRVKEIRQGRVFVSDFAFFMGNNTIRVSMTWEKDVEADHSLLTVIPVEYLWMTREQIEDREHKAQQEEQMDAQRAIYPKHNVLNDLRKPCPHPDECKWYNFDNRCGGWFCTTTTKPKWMLDKEAEK